MNKKGAQNVMVWVVIALVGGYLLMQGGFFEGTTVETLVPAGGGLAPSDLQTTFDFSFKDELATTETTVNAVWYAFRSSDGSFVNTATASSGTSSLTTNFGEEYDVWAYTTGYGGYIAKKTRINANSAKVSVPIKLIKRGALEVSGVDDPIDLNANISATAGATEEFRVKWKVNVSNAGILDPIIYVETNSTSTGVEDIMQTKTDSAGGEWTEITCPSRLSQSSVKEVFYCFKRDKMALARDGVIITSFVMKIDDTTAPDGGDGMNVRMADTGMYLEPGYTNINGILFDAEDDSNSMIGTPADAVVQVLGYDG